MKSIAWKGYKYTFVNQAEYRYFALQLAPKIPVHVAGSFVVKAIGAIAQAMHNNLHFQISCKKGNCDMDS